MDKDCEMKNLDSVREFCLQCSDLELLRKFCPEAKGFLANIEEDYLFCKAVISDYNVLCEQVCKDENEDKLRMIRNNETMEEVLQNSVLVTEGDSFTKVISICGTEIPRVVYIKKLIKDWLNYIINAKDALLQYINITKLVYLPDSSVTLKAVMDHLENEDELREQLKRLSKAFEHINYLNNISKHRTNLNVYYLCGTGLAKPDDYMLDDPDENEKDYSLRRIFELTDALFTIIYTIAYQATISIPASKICNRKYVVYKHIVLNPYETMSSTKKNFVNVGIEEDRIIEIVLIHKQKGPDQLLEKYCQMEGPSETVYLMDLGCLPENYEIRTTRQETIEVRDMNNMVIGYYRRNDDGDTLDPFTEYRFEPTCGVV